MKKTLLTLALAAFAFAANAQFVIGGQLGFTTTGGTTTVEKTALTNEYDFPNTQTNALTIAPSFGYVINEKMQAGLSLSYTLNTNKTFGSLAYYNDKEDWSKTTSSMFEIAPYFRYYFANAGKFNFFCEATLGFGFSPRTKNHDYDNTLTTVVDNEYWNVTKSSYFGITVVPGVNYRINDHFSADLYIDLAGLAFMHSSTKTYAGTADDADLASTSTSNVFGLIANTSAQDINSHFNNFRIGFNYHF